MLHVPDKQDLLIKVLEADALLNIVLCCDIASSEVSDAIYRYDTNVLYGSQEVLKANH